MFLGGVKQPFFCMFPGIKQPFFNKREGKTAAQQMRLTPCKVGVGQCQEVRLFPQWADFRSQQTTAISLV